MPALRRGIRRLAAVALLADDRRDVDDAAGVLGLEQQRRRRARCSENAPARFDVDASSPTASSENRISRPLTATPALLTRMSSPPCSLPIALIASVTAALFATSKPHDRGLAARRLDLGRSRLARRVLARRVVDDDLGAAPTERDRDRATDAARRAGDERNLALEVLCR